MNFTKLPFKEFLTMMDRQSDCANEFYKCCKLYACEKVNKNIMLYRFNEETLLWNTSSEPFFNIDYVRWMTKNQLAYIASGQLAQEEILLLVKKITSNTDYNNVLKIYKNIIPHIHDDNLSEKFDKLFPLLIPMNNNKCYDLETSTIIDRTKEHYMTYHYDVSYTNNKANQIDDLLNKLCCYDEDVKLYLQKILGYCMSGSNSGQVFFVFNGKGSNGKSLLLNLVKACLNKGYGAVDKAIMIKEKSSNIGNAFYALSKRRLGVFSETEEGEKLAVENIKKISGNDTISCKKLYDNLGEHDFKIPCKLIMCTNKLPHFDSTQHSLTRRLRLFKFNASFVDILTGKENEFLKDADLEQKIINNYLNEFFSWCVDGFNLYKLDNSFNKDVPECVNLNQQEYIKNQNSFKCFIDDCIDITKDDKNTIERSLFYSKYIDYCKEYDISIILKKKEIFDLADNELSKSVKLGGIFKYKYCKFKIVEEEEDNSASAN